mmetsp:Transcript_24208/g.77699  ORF Transcript_24208/g.77699 Transcript_24208/m.77699 type:complete len:91 (+) Transcript_24208:2090-2362(+)
MNKVARLFIHRDARPGYDAPDATPWLRRAGAQERMVLVYTLNGTLVPPTLRVDARRPQGIAVVPPRGGAHGAACFLLFAPRNVLQEYCAP